MEINDSNGIRWDKLEELLKLSSLSPDSTADLSAEEKEALLFLRRAGMLMRQEYPDRDFPVDAGWMRVKDYIDAGVLGKEAPIRRIRRWLYAAAVMLPLLLAGVYWLSRQHGRTGGNPVDGGTSGMVANLPPTRGVQLILADGQRVGLDKAQILKERNGATIHADSGLVTYQPVAAGDRRSPAPETISPGAAVLYNTLEVPRGNQSRLILPDGTKVWINAGSRLTYPTVFTGNTRELTVEGEAFFEVSKDPAHPFIVHAKGTAVEVMGTAFDINTYDPVLLTTLTEGRVRVTEKAVAVTLEPGDQAAYDAGKDALHKRSNVDTYLFTSWKDGIIYLEGASFQKIAEQLGRRYDYDLAFEDTALADLHFTLNMKAPDKLQDALNYITSTIEGVGFITTGREVRFFRTKQGK